MKTYVNTELNTKAVDRAVRRSMPKTLKSAAAYVRAVARNSIKTRKNKNKASMPGTPPISHPDDKQAGFKKTILFYVDANKKTAIVGPALIHGGFQNVGRLHEFGGMKRVKAVDPELMDGVKIGQKAPVLESYVSKKKDRVLKRDARFDKKTGKDIVWIQIRTKSQAEHATRLYRRMVRDSQQYVMAHFPKRPYMGPALNKSLPKLSSFWANSVRN